MQVPNEGAYGTYHAAIGNLRVNENMQACVEDDDHVGKVTRVPFATGLICLLSVRYTLDTLINKTCKHCTVAVVQNTPKEPCAKRQKQTLYNA